MCDIDIVKTCMRSTLNTSTRTGRPEALPDPEGGSSGTSASAAATFIIERITWLRISASLVLIFRLIDSRASKHSSCKYDQKLCQFLHVHRIRKVGGCTIRTFSRLSSSAVKLPFSRCSSNSSITAWSTIFSSECFNGTILHSLCNEGRKNQYSCSSQNHVQCTIQ